MVKFFKSIVLSFKPISYLFRLSQRIIIPGFDGLPLYNVSVFFVKGLTERSITQRASAISFSMFMALFPTIIFMFTLIAYVPIPNFQQVLLDNISNLVPDNTYDVVRLTLEDIVTRQRGELLSVGFFLAFIFSTNGIMSLMAAFNSTYHDIETRSLVWQYIISFFLVIVLAFFVIISISMIIIGPRTLELIVQHITTNKKIIYYLLYSIKWLLVLISIFMLTSLLFYIAPNKKTRFRFISPGSTLTTVLFVLSSVGFNYYINHFGKYNKLYGYIGTLLIVMVWIYVNAIVLLIGFELNASIKQAKLKAGKT